VSLRVVVACALCALLDGLVCGSFWVEADGPDRVAVADGSCPPLGVARLRLGVDPLTLGQDLDVTPFVALSGGHVIDRAVAVLLVVPADESLDPGPGRLEAREGLGGVRGAVLVTAPMKSAHLLAMRSANKRTRAAASELEVAPDAQGLARGGGPDRPRRAVAAPRPSLARRTGGGHGAPPHPDRVRRHSLGRVPRR
jgi:hypothetical protein